MIDALLHLLGLRSLGAAELAVLALAATVLASLVGILIDGLNKEASFGATGNAAVLLSAMAAGLIGYAQMVQPLRLISPAAGLGVALSSAVIGFLALGLAKARIER